ncbi:MAG: dTDP-glucose 4,6-dehydratase, partial [Actinomycetota bacterium]
MWARLINAALGAWLMAAPHVLGYGNLAATVAHVAGPVILGSSVVAAWPVLRPLRWVSLAAGVCVFASA